MEESSAAEKTPQEMMKEIKTILAHDDGIPLGYQIAIDLGKLAPDELLQVYTIAKVLPARRKYMERHGLQSADDIPLDDRDYADRECDYT